MAGVEIVIRVNGSTRQGTLDRTGKPLRLEFKNGEKVTVLCKGKGGRKSSGKVG